LPDPRDGRGWRDLDSFMNQLCGGGLRALVVTHSRAEAESSYILAGEIGKSAKLLMAAFERGQASVIEVEVDLPTLLKMVGSPGEAYRMFRPVNDGQ
jgi:hypothetical protein